MNLLFILLRQTTTFNPVKILTALCLAVFLSGCAHLTYLDQAQDSFSKGAALENQSLFAGENKTPMVAETYYSLAYGQVQNALRSEGKLKSVDVLGTALSVKAMCEWKLKDYKKAADTAKEAKNALQNEPGDAASRRDFIVMSALSGLMEIEKTNTDLYAFFGGSGVPVQDAKNKYEEIIRNKDSETELQKGLRELGEIISNLNGNKDLKIYILMSRIAGIKVWDDGLSMTVDEMRRVDEFSGENKTWRNDEEKLMLKEKDDALKLLSELLGEENKDLYQKWEDLF